LVAFFDSGIGGLTVLYEALRLLPGEKYLYFSDGDHAPYGTRPREEVRQLVLNAAAYMAQYQPKAMVIACNTATSVAIDDLRRQYTFPVIGMEPAVKPALELHPNQRVLVFATELTLKLEKFQHLVDRIDTDNRVDYLPLQELVMMAERFEFEADIKGYLQNKLAPFDLSRYGAVVLGCTHFPFFKPWMRQVLPPHIDIIDGNLGTVRNLRSKLEGMLNPGPGETKYVISGKPQPPARFEAYLQLLRDQETACFE
jgi:glutamate racemase